MTAAYRLKGVGWFGGCVAVILGFYLVSLQVAGERKKLEQVNARIAAAERDIRALETEFDTRANLVQLEKWNGDTLALAAPTAGQFVSDEAALASVDVTRRPDAAGDPRVQSAQLVVPSGMPAAAPQQAAMTLVAATAPLPDTRAAAAVAAAAPVRMASASVRPAADRSPVTRAAAAVANVRPEAVALLDRKLLSDNTIGDILSGARAEARRSR
jgi:hypothetical protein